MNNSTVSFIYAVDDACNSPCIRPWMSTRVVCASYCLMCICVMFWVCLGDVLFFWKSFFFFFLKQNQTLMLLPCVLWDKYSMCLTRSLPRLRCMLSIANGCKVSEVEGD